MREQCSDRKYTEKKKKRERDTQLNSKGGKAKQKTI